MNIEKKRKKATKFASEQAKTMAPMMTPMFKNVTLDEVRSILEGHLTYSIMMSSTLCDKLSHSSSTSHKKGHKRKDIPQDKRCQALTSKSGKQCRNSRRMGNKYCNNHQNYQPTGNESFLQVQEPPKKKRKKSVNLKKRKEQEAQQTDDDDSDEEGKDSDKEGEDTEIIPGLEDLLDDEAEDDA